MTEKTIVEAFTGQYGYEPDPAAAEDVEDLAIFRAGYLAARAAEQSIFEEALRQTWQMVDPLRPAGAPGSYARGSDNGAIAALRTVRENFERIARQRTEAGT